MILRNSLIIIVRYMMAQKSDEVRKKVVKFKAGAELADAIV